jgi:hypothetical protein
MPRINLFDGILVGNKGSVNNTQMRHYNLRVKLHISKCSKYATSEETIKDALKFASQNLNLNDYHIPFSYVRIEIDPKKSTKLPLNKIVNFGTSCESTHFDSNLDVSTSSYDYIYIHQAMDTCPLDKLLSQMDEKFKLTFANRSDSNGCIELKITLYYHYLGSDF